MKPAKITAVCDLLDLKKAPGSTEFTIEYSDMNSTYSRTFSQISSQGKSMPRCLQILKLKYEDQKINTESQIVYAGRSNYDLALLYSDVSSWLTLSKGIITKFDRESAIMFSAQPIISDNSQSQDLKIDISVSSNNCEKMTKTVKLKVLDDIFSKPEISIPISEFS